MNVFFAGTPDCAIPALHAIATAYPLAGVLTAPPARVGRGKQYADSAIAQAVADLKTHGVIAQAVPVLTPEKLNADFREAAAALKPDILVCFAYGKIFGPKTLALFPQGALNIHPSLLPRWRGPSPVPAAIFAGDSISGVTVQYMAQEMDAGDIVLLGASLIVQALAMVETGSVVAAPQNHTAATYCTLLQKDSGLLCWHDDAVALDRKIRAYTPWPGAFTYWMGSKLSIIQAHPYIGSVATEAAETPGLVLDIDKREGILVQTGKGVLAIQMLQKETKKAMQWKDFLNGAAGFIGTTLQSLPKT